jgi:hypothetical protein
MFRRRQYGTGAAQRPLVESIEKLVEKQHWGGREGRNAVLIRNNRNPPILFTTSESSRTLALLSSSAESQPLIYKLKHVPLKEAVNADSDTHQTRRGIGKNRKSIGRYFLVH